MSQMFVIGEDALCCAFGERLVVEVLGWTLAQPAVDTKGVTNLKKNLARYLRIANLHPVLCLADTDGKCALHMRSQWLPEEFPDRFLLRLAVSEIESWVMADRDALANFFGVSASIIPSRPDELQDPKQAILNLARRSRQRNIAQEVISRSNNKPGSGYNAHLREFVLKHWRPRIAEESSPSLARAIRRLTELNG